MHCEIKCNNWHLLHLEWGFVCWLPTSRMYRVPGGSSFGTTAPPEARYVIRGHQKLTHVVYSCQGLESDSEESEE